MDFESECSVLESVEDNEEIKNVSLPVNLENISESKVQNGYHAVQNNDNNELLSKINGKGPELLGSFNSHPMEMKPEVSPSPPATAKGYGLKKWRRIKRDATIGGESSTDTGKMVAQDLRNSGVGSSKRAQIYTEKTQKSEGSASSTNAVVRSLDGFVLLGDSGFATGPLFAAGTDSENSEDRSSKSSTAASVPKIKYERPVVVGLPHDKSRMRTSSGKHLTHSVQRGPQGKGRIETSKKARGERVKIEKENSHSSVESDSRSSNFVFMQGIYSSNNGIRSERPVDYDGENGDEVQGGERQVSDGLRGDYGRDGEGDYENISPEDVVADSSWGVKKERSDNHGTSTDQDPLVESINALQSAQEALEKEVLKFKEIGKDVPVDDSVSNLPPEFTDVEQKLQESFEQLLSGKDVDISSSQAGQPEVVETEELEELFKQKIETEVEYLALYKMVQNLRSAAVTQTVLEEQKALASHQTQILHKLEGTENKALMLKKQAEKLEFFCEDIANADETLKLQKRVFKYSSCFFVQLVLLVVILGVFISQSSPNNVEVVPT
ncbi:hypothetical protein ACJIZ3_012956 [Penstemon smallii]|uniref:Uncharacterized protein n=1 Tax=Penstemon smallii TaxID=265156 RepID=A0ABD3UNI1_9LAMI